jgi:hypothetical protein
MQTRHWRFNGFTGRKHTWGAGPWSGEPDKAQWPDPKTGLPSLAVRGEQTGGWHGYVGVAPGHPYYERRYQDLDNLSVNESAPRLTCRRSHEPRREAVLAA